VNDPGRQRERRRQRLFGVVHATVPGDSVIRAKRRRLHSAIATAHVARFPVTTRAISIVQKNGGIIAGKMTTRLARL
jgi:hypothetical protein